MGDKLYYVVEPLPKSIFGVGGGGGGSTSDQFLGTFLRPQNSPPGTNAEQKRLDSGPTYLGVRDVRFRQISLHGGTPRDAATFRTARVSLLGNQVFWVRPGPEERSATIRMQEDRNRPYWREVTAHSDLMLTSLTNGVTRCIRHGIPYNTNLHAGEVGVAWIEAAPFPEPPTLFYARVSDGSVRSLGAPAKENEFTNWASKHFAEFGNRLYWLSVSQNGNDPSVLVSANLNGKDIRNVCTQRDSHPMDVRSLHGYKGNLYCCIVEPPVMSPGVAPRNQYLCRVHPARADPLEIVYQLPKGFAFDQLDGGYLYLIRSELKRSLWATITDDPGGALTVDTHYRISLDR